MRAVDHDTHVLRLTVDSHLRQGDPAGQPGDRSTTFQPVTGGGEQRSGETLLVVAYAGLWALLMGWVLLQWTKQSALARRLGDLESAIAKAAAKTTPGKADPP
jgi:hypothetical protein